MEILYREKKRKLLIARQILLLSQLKNDQENTKLCKNVEVKKKRKKRTAWVQLAYTEREQLGQFVKLKKYRVSSPKLFFDYLRMMPKEFDELHALVKHKIERVHLVRKPICSEERLALTLRYLASGNSMRSMAFDFLIGRSTVSRIIRETCTAIWEALEPLVFPELCEEFWMEKAEEFKTRWNFPNCIGAIDGKHVVVQAFDNCGSDYFSHKHTHSINLMAVADAKYKFIYCGIGAKGRESDGGVFKSSEFGMAMEEKKLRLPKPSSISPRHHDMPYVLVGDEAFPLKENLMRPYPGKNIKKSKKQNLTAEARRKRIYNYRLSRARRVVENAFGILVQKWRIFKVPINAKVTVVELIIKACVCLHNFLLDRKYDYYSNIGTIKNVDLTGTAFGKIKNSKVTFHKRSVAEIRVEYADFFSTDGGLDFQDAKVFI